MEIPIQTSELLLEQLQVASSVGLPVGVHDVECHVSQVSQVADYLRASLTATVLSDDAGKVVEARTFYWQKTKPWWLPGFLWKRVPEQRETAVAVARPKWTYPQASIRVPDLGPAVFKVLEW